MTETELEQSLNEYFKPENFDDKEQFVVDTLDKANWVVGLMQLRKNEIAEKQAFAERKIAEIQAWLEKEIAPLESTLKWGEMVLRPFAESQLATLKKKSKTVALPNAKLSFKKPTTQYSRDDEQLLEFIASTVDDADQFINVKKTVKWADFKKTLIEADDGNLITQDGVVVEGVKWSRADVDEFTVIIKGE